MQRCWRCIKDHSIIFFLIIGILAFFLFWWIQWFGSTSAEEISYFIFFATALLAFVAYVEFQRANKLAGNEFLLFISNRWGSKEIITARQIIHVFFVQNYRKEKSPVFNDYTGSLHHTAKNILELSRESDEDGNRFIFLLNLIDYLETISFFYVRGDLGIEDIQNTCGHNFIFLHAVFRLYKEQRQRHDSTYFHNIDKLHEDLKNKIENKC